MKINFYWLGIWIFVISLIIISFSDLALGENILLVVTIIFVGVYFIYMFFETVLGIDLVKLPKSTKRGNK